LTKLTLDKFCDHVLIIINFIINIIIIMAILLLANIILIIFLCGLLIWCRVNVRLLWDFEAM